MIGSTAIVSESDLTGASDATVNPANAESMLSSTLQVSSQGDSREESSGDEIIWALQRMFIKSLELYFLMIPSSL
jgi:hypothetical protein